MSFIKFHQILAGACLATPAFSGTFHHDGLDLKQSLAQLELAGCALPDSRPLPKIDEPFYAGLGQETTSCASMMAAYGLLDHLTSDQAMVRYQSIRYIKFLVNQWGQNVFSQRVGSLAQPYREQLNFMAVLDLPYIADYAKGLSVPGPSLQNKKVTGQDLSKRRIEGEVCYHTAFSQSDLSQSTWHFRNVTRYCNFSDVKAHGSTFVGWLYMQTFENTDLEGSRFELSGNGRSEIKFINCNLKNARFVGDLSRVTFMDSDLTGAILNGKTCTDQSGAGCLGEPAP